MGQWLDRLKAKYEKGPSTEPTKLTKDPSVGFVSMDSKDFENFQALQLQLKILEERYQACVHAPEITPHNDWLLDKRAEAMARLEKEIANLRQ